MNCSYFQHEEEEEEESKTVLAIKSAAYLIVGVGMVSCPCLCQSNF